MAGGSHDQQDGSDEATLVLIKPDAVRRRLIGDVIARIEAKGLRIEAMRMMQLERARAEEHYREHVDKPFFEELVSFIASGPLVAMCVAGDDAIAAVRQVMGATDPLQAAPGSLRGRYATDIAHNLVHGSDSAASAQRELALFFPDRFGAG